jgi:hypothetical protein
VTDCGNTLEWPGEAGAAKEYNGCGALGSVGLELLLADDSGRLYSSLSFSLCFCRDKKWCLCFSSFCVGGRSESPLGGTNVDVEAFAEEYMEALPLIGPGSAKLVVDWFIIMRLRACELWMPIPILPGEGSVCSLPSYCLSTLMALGLELNSFILLFPSFAFCSCGTSGVEAGFGDPRDCAAPSMPGECSGLRGNAALAPVAAAVLLISRLPLFEYVTPLVLKVIWLGNGGGLMGWLLRDGCALSPGAGMVVERFRLCWAACWAYAACAAIWLALRLLLEGMMSRSPPRADDRLGSK